MALLFGELQLMKTALVVIDLQRGVLAMSTEPRPAAAVLANAVGLTEAFRGKDAFVALVRVTHATVVGRTRVD